MAPLLTRPTISLVIPAYNEEAYLPACLEAVMRNLAGKLLEIIVVDNNSTDGTKAIVERYREVTYLFEPNKGITRARQCGFAAATGDIIAYVDADTRPPAGWVEQILEQFAAQPNLAVLSGPYSFYDLSGIRNKVSAGWFVAARPLSKITGYLMVGGNFAIRRDVLEKMGGFDRSIEFYAPNLLAKYCFPHVLSCRHRAGGWQDRALPRSRRFISPITARSRCKANPPARSTKISAKRACHIAIGQDAPNAP